MKTKNTLILLVLTVALASFIILWEKKQPNTEEVARQSKNVLNFSLENVTGMVVQNGDDKIELKRTDKKWRLEGPIKDQADANLLEGVLGELDSWPKDRTITAREIEEKKDQLNELGLNKPKLRLKLLGKDMPPEIWFGKDAAMEGKMYVRFENAKDTFVVSTSVKKAIEKKPDDFRDKKLTDLNIAQITRAILKTPAGEMELEKKGNQWEIVRPLRARGDEQKIGDWLAQVTTAQIQQFVADDRGDLHPYGLAEPRGALTLFAENDKNGQLLQIGSIPEKQQDQVYVRFAARGFVYTLPKKIEEILNAKPNDLRDRHLAKVDQNILDRITVEAAGKGKVTLARKGEGWNITSRKDAPAEIGEVNRLVTAVNNEQVTKFVEDVASNLAKYGLDKPQVQLTFSSFASENTAETSAGEKPIANISFGRTEGEEVYARVNDEPFVVAVRKAFLNGLLTEGVQWQKLAVFDFKPDEIHRLGITTDNEAALVRGPNNQWSWSKGSGPINQGNLVSLLNTLSRLHAVRWTPEAGSGFDKPQLVVTFTTSPDDKAAHKLTVGGSAGNNMWFARVDEREGVFVLSNPDLNALKLSLLEAPVPAPSPAGGAAASPGASPVVATSPVAAPTAKKP